MKNKTLSEAVHKSREFYSMSLPKDSQFAKGEMTKAVYDGVQSGALAPNLMSMHYNFYWYRMILEDCRFYTDPVLWIRLRYPCSSL